MKLSKRSAIALTVISISLLCSYGLWNIAQQQEQNRQEQLMAEMSKAMNAKIRIVYCIKDIPIGAPITVRELEEREIDKGNAPEDAMMKVHDCVGRSAKYAISNGEILSQHDLSEKGEAWFVVTLSQGTRKTLSDLAAKSGVSSSEMATKLIQNKLK